MHLPSLEIELGSGSGSANEVLMRLESALANESLCPSGGKGIHSLQIPSQTHQTPFATGASDSAQRELPEFHDPFDQSEYRLDGGLAQGIQLATRVASAGDGASPPTRVGFPVKGGGSLKRSRNERW